MADHGNFLKWYVRQHVYSQDMAFVDVSSSANKCWELFMDVELMT